MQIKCLARRNFQLSVSTQRNVSCIHANCWWKRKPPWFPRNPSLEPQRACLHRDNYVWWNSTWEFFTWSNTSSWNFKLCVLKWQLSGPYQFWFINWTIHGLDTIKIKLFQLNLCISWQHRTSTKFNSRYFRVVYFYEIAKCCKWRMVFQFWTTPTSVYFDINRRLWYIIEKNSSIWSRLLLFSNKRNNFACNYIFYYSLRSWHKHLNPLANLEHYSRRLLHSCQLQIQI